MSEYFYGWYFRCQSAGESLAVIPAVHVSKGRASCSVQVLTQSQSFYREFPIAQFRVNREKMVMQIGENLFSRKGIRLRLEAEREVMIQGILKFGEFSEPAYDIMGPFACIPCMECRHAVYSMRHTVSGEIRLGEKTLCFRDAAGYMEGDSGSSFPERYLWTQHFLPEGSLMTAAATVPLAGLRFTGTVGFVLWKGREYRFATYLGAVVKQMGQRELLIRQGRYQLHVQFFPDGKCAGEKKEGQGSRSVSDKSLLRAPVKGRMERRVREDVACKAEYTLSYGKRVLLHAVTDRAAAEYDEFW